MKQYVYRGIQSGGRKTAYATVFLTDSNGAGIVVNGKPVTEYFQNNSLFLQTLLNIYETVQVENPYNVVITVRGGGLSAQAQAARLGLCKSFSSVIPHLRPYFKKKGYLTRDARIKERRKYGLKKARKAPQFSKR